MAKLRQARSKRVALFNKARVAFEFHVKFDATSSYKWIPTLVLLDTFTSAGDEF